ncbi:uncharacterized protein LOC124282168 [Haliotis rubra]|uniref:uncharacterized protein LOC124282168 n=1 Tax=Haliotis rubra TaxID=36100 RepID=UPI001EE61219|nr:uncharacterized protein LOC124282168 [Haliotis rubra]
MDLTTSGTIHLKFDVGLTPNGPEDVLGDDGDPPLTATAFGTGIVFDPDSFDDLVAITFNDWTPNGIYSFDRQSSGQIALRYSYHGNTGRIDVSNGYLYMNDGQEIIRRPLDGSGDWEQVHVFSASIKEFAVLCNGNIAFCDDAGAVYIYDAVDDVYKQTKKPVAGECCASVEVNHCNGLIYVANVNDTEIEVYNATSRKLVDLVVYTESTPSQCPSIAFDPTFCCA